MGCLGSKSIDENENKKEKNEDEKSNKNNNTNKNNKEKKDKIKLDKSGKNIDNTENKDSNNVNTEQITSENQKLSLHKQKYEGVILMKGVEECIPENLKENEIYDLVEQALSGNKEYNKITKKQAKAISNILYKKIQKNKINMKDYPELNGLNVKVGSEKLTKDLIRKMMFNNDKNIDEYQIDLTYLNLTKNNDNIKVLSIELLDD